MPALRVCHFQSEVAAGKPLYLPDQPSDQRVIAVAEKGGQIIGGLLAEDSVVVTMIGLEQSVAQSAYDAVISTILAWLAMRELALWRSGYRVESSLICKRDGTRTSKADPIVNRN